MVEYKNVHHAIHDSTMEARIHYINPLINQKQPLGDYFYLTVEHNY
jgi:hypothetical protein